MNAVNADRGVRVYDPKSPKYSKDKARRGYTSVDAIDPHDGKTWQLLISDSKAAWIAKQGMGRTKELCYTVRGVLAAPTAIFKGVRFAELEIADDDWLCYVGQPQQAYDHKTGEAVPPWPNEVFLVFVTDERVVYNWYWYDCDKDTPSLPIGHKDRFAQRVL